MPLPLTLAANQLASDSKILAAEGRKLCTLSWHEFFMMRLGS